MATNNTVNSASTIFWNAARTSFTIGPKNLPQTVDSLDLYIINTVGLPTATAGAPFGLVALGRNALASTTTGAENVAIGNGTLQNLTTGYSNVTCGNGAMLNAIASHDNTAFGHNSLQAGTATGFLSTALGAGAGTTVNSVTSYNRNTFLGANTTIDNTSTEPLYRTAIGCDTVVGEDHLVQLGAAEAVGIGLYGATPPASIGTGGSTFAALSVSGVGASGFNQLRSTGQTGTTGLDGAVLLASTGADGTVGQATIAAGTTVITVNTTAALTASNIFATIAGFTGTASLALGTVGVGNIVNGVSFDITIASSVPAVSTVLVNWFIINP